ncbi:MAG: helix-turn-helix transcriptional regulator [Acidimicrobiia bacterium]
MDKRLPHGVRAQRHRLLADARRLAIVEALSEGPRQIPELARLLGVHTTTVRAHLDKLLEAGVLQEEAGVPAGRGRPSKRYRLKHPLLGGDPEVRLVVGSMVSLVRDAYGDGAVEAAVEEGARKGRQLAPHFRHPSLEQTAREVANLLERLSFDPTPPVRRRNALTVDLQHCPFRIDPRDPDGVLVCAFHEGLVRGLAEVASGGNVGVRVLPFIEPGVCRVELCSQDRAPAPDPPEAGAPVKRKAPTTGKAATPAKSSRSPRTNPSA